MPTPAQDTGKRDKPANHQLEQPQKDNSAMKKTEFKGTPAADQPKIRQFVPVNAPARIHIKFNDDDQVKGQKRPIESKDEEKVSKKTMQEMKLEEKMDLMDAHSDDSSDVDPAEEARLRARLAAIDEKKLKNAVAESVRAHLAVHDDENRKKAVDDAVRRAIEPVVESEDNKGFKMTEKTEAVMGEEKKGKKNKKKKKKNKEQAKKQDQK